ncbi:MAG: CBS domain-containing protein [Nitrospirales bacterium]
MKTLAHVMTTVLQKISSQSSVAMASKQMREAQVGSLVIERHGELMRDREEQIIGLITETDIIRKAVAEELDLKSTAVDTVMTSPMITVEASWPIEEAVDMMKDSGVRHLLVTQNKVVVGLVSLRDLLANLKESS